MSNEINLETETTNTTTEDVVVEARVNKSTLQVAAIASAAGAAVAGVACLLMRRNKTDDTDGFVPVVVVPASEDDPSQD